MQAITLHDTETEEIVGTVYPLTSINFNNFFDNIYNSWKNFCSEGLDEDYSIEDFVEFHNNREEVQIDYVVMDYIQL
jgi:hypothetical protein